jgi:hypothetical protein
VAKSEDESSTADLQIDKDLLRSLTNNYCFSKADYPGVVAMRRILKAVAFLYPDVGYCQAFFLKHTIFADFIRFLNFKGMGVVVASLLLVCFEEHVFWV